MTKKSRRARKTQRSTPPKITPNSSVQIPQVTVAAGEENAPDFAEYAYVVADLRRVAILAVAMFALLVALSFFIG